jgi:hypothetical protein
MEEAIQALRDAGVSEDLLRRALDDTEGMREMMATDVEANRCIHASLLTYRTLQGQGGTQRTLIAALARCYYKGLQRGRSEGANDI